MEAKTGKHVQKKKKKKNNPRTTTASKQGSCGMYNVFISPQIIKAKCTAATLGHNLHFYLCTKCPNYISVGSNKSTRTTKWRPKQGSMCKKKKKRITPEPPLLRNLQGKHVFSSIEGVLSVMVTKQEEGKSLSKALFTRQHRQTGEE
jgi:hypothetical protein